MRCISRHPVLIAMPRQILISNASSRNAPHRSFVSNPFSKPQQLTASRTIQAPASVVYDVISDVASYHHFVPYCQESTVTKQSAPTAVDGRTYPEEAKLLVGFNNNVSESFWSRVYCVPGRIVEAISGATDTTLRGDAIAHHSARPSPESDPTRQGKVLSELSTRWTLRPFPYKPPPSSAVHPETTHKNHDETSPIPAQHQTEVSLQITYQFANPVYVALSQAAAPLVADKMIDAFENRVRAVMQGPGNVKATKAI